MANFGRQQLTPRLARLVGAFALMSLIGLGNSQDVYAQVPCFNIIGSEAQCAPGKIVVINCVVGTNVYYIPDSTNQRFIINGRPGVDTIRYSTPGRYRLGQGVLVGGTNLSTFRTVYILNNRKPVPRIKACDNYLVQVDIPKIEGERFIVAYGDGRQDTTANSTDTLATLRYRYMASATNPSFITVKSLYNCGQDTTLQVQLRPPLIGPDSLVVSQANRNTINVKVVSTIGYAYKVEAFVGGAYQSQPFSMQDDRNISILNALTGAGCYRVTCQDLCGTPIAVYPFCMSVMQVNSESEYMQLRYSAGSNSQTVATRPINVRLIKNQGSLSIQTMPNGSLVTGISVRDSAITCDRQYCYAVSYTYSYRYVLNQTTAMRITSLPICVLGRSTKIPLAEQSLTVSKLGFASRLSWKAPTAYAVKQYIISRYNFNALKPSRVDTTSKIIFVDQENETSASRFQYTIKFRDSCNNISVESGRVSACLLQARAVTVTYTYLQWLKYLGGPKLPKLQQLQLLDKSDNILRTTDLDRDTVDFEFRERFDASQVLRFRLKIIPDTNILDTAYSNIAEVVQLSAVLMPNAFSPNRDNINDLYIIQAKFISDFQIRILNRWGLIVYESYDQTLGWDGLVNGTNAPIDVYVATITGKDETGKPVSQTQMVTLIR